MRLHFLLSLLLLALLIIPARADEPENVTPPPAAPEPASANKTVLLPGKGAGPLVVNPNNGLVWTFFHQTHEMVAINCTTGETVLKEKIDLVPSAFAFTPDGSTGIIVGEPIDEQIIAAGIVQAFDSTTGKKLAETKLDGAATAVCVADDGTIYVATGMQYEYAGIVYQMKWEPKQHEFDSIGQVKVGKLPWALEVFDGNLYVTDSELQWTAQPDGSQGPPWGGLVWVFETPSLQFVNKIWVGINPSSLAQTQAGLVVGCSGRKQTEGLYEPAAVLMRSTEMKDSDYIFAGTSGAGDITAVRNQNWAIVSLVNLGDPFSGQGMSVAKQIFGTLVPEAKSWVYTGDVALIDFDQLAKLKAERASQKESATEPETATEQETPGSPLYNLTPIHLVTDKAYIRSVALSTDGKKLYALKVDDKEETESILVVPVDSLRNTESEAPVD